MALEAFYGSILLLFFVARKRTIPFLSPFGLYISYSLLYNLVPYYTAAEGLTVYSLSADPELRAAQLVLSALANCGFAAVYLWKFRPHRLGESSRRVESTLKHERLFEIVYFSVFFLILPLVRLYGWHALAQESLLQGEFAGGGKYSAVAYLKLFFLGMYLFHLAYGRLGQSTFAFLLAQAIVMAVDGSRTTFVMALIASLHVLLPDGGRHRSHSWKTWGFVIAALIGVLLVRAVSLGNARTAASLDVLLAEGILGSYSTLQVIYVERLTVIPHLWGLNYVLDPILALAPIHGSGALFFDTWVASANRILIEPFSPNGGFYFVAEAVMAFGWMGPILVSSAFAMLLVGARRHLSKRNSLHLALVASFGSLFEKTTFLNGFKLFVGVTAVILFFRFTWPVRNRFVSSADARG